MSGRKFLIVVMHSDAAIMASCRSVCLYIGFGGGGASSRDAEAAFVFIYCMLLLSMSLASLMAMSSRSTSFLKIERTVSCTVGVFGGMVPIESVSF